MGHCEMSGANHPHLGVGVRLRLGLGLGLGFRGHLGTVLVEKRRW